MKKIFAIIYFFIVPIIVFSQDSIHKKNVRENFQISIKTGGYYKFFKGSKYIKPTTTNTYNDITHQYDGFTRHPTKGVGAGIFLNYKLYKIINVGIGLFYCNRKDVYESNPDTVYKYHNSVNQPINDITNYEYSYKNVEMPLMLSFKWKKINFGAALNFTLWSYRRATYTYMVAPAYGYSGWETTQKVIEGREKVPKAFPSLQLSYDFKTKFISISPFVGIDFGKNKSYYLQYGLIFHL